MSNTTEDLWDAVMNILCRNSLGEMDYTLWDKRAAELEIMVQYFLARTIQELKR